MPDGVNERNLDPGIRLALQEIRDLRLEMREDRRRWEAESAAERRRWEAESAAERRRAAADRQRADAERRRSDERFAAMLRDFREDSARREAATQQAFRDIRTVGLSIVKTLNRHTRILERIDRKLGGRSDGRPDNGRAA